MKNLKNLGKALSKAEQKTINGGKDPAPICAMNSDCDPYNYGQFCCGTFRNQCIPVGSGQCV